LNHVEEMHRMQISQLESNLTDYLITDFELLNSS